MENKQIILDEEELGLIGEHRYRKEHYKGFRKIAIISLACAVILTVVLYKTAPGITYIFGILPAAVPGYLSARLQSKASKAGEKFAEGLIKKPVTDN